MATDTQFSKIKQSVASIRAGLAGVARDENTEGRSGFHLTDVGPWLSKAASRSWQAVTETRIARYISQSLTRLIIFANLLAFAILVGGWMILSQQNIWLIDAKRAALVTQSRILAAAIATETMRRSGSPFDNAAEYDPDVIIDQAARSITTPAQSLAKLDFEIKPEQVAPVLARLIAGTNARARIYATDGTMVLDSNAFLETGGVAPSNAAEGDPRYVKPKNFWTRFLKWRLASSLPVYQDRNDISGLSYPEVRKSIKNGETYSMLLMSGSGNQVVAISSPVVSAGDVKGVLMLSTQPGEIGEILSGERLRIGLLAIIAGLATIIASILLARTVAGPMRRLSDAAEAVTADMTASQALPTFPGREDEVAQVARSFENMTSAMRRRIEASERFAADVAHELKNPLTAARTTAESLVYARTEEQRDGLVTQIGEELRRLDRLISDVSNIQRLDAELALQETEPVNLAELINGV
ncbi:MAG: stimulus-sensing domain-containing protein, partial [Pseudomonadota bacterium]